MEIDVGSVVGDYQVIGILGAGGMGKVYKVRNTISDRLEAMKVLLPDLAREPELADRFLREIRVQASLDHPNIAGLRTAVRCENQLLMIIELVEGVTLEQRLRQGPLSVPEAVNSIAQVLSALSYAHRAGVVHRDIKPANMMLTAHGVIKLMDFGIAKGATDRRLTMTGTTMGSLYYMSPEQINGEQTLDARADLYSLGITLYELVTGKKPFDGDSQYAIMSAHLEKAPVPPITLDPNLPPALNEVIMVAVQKDPAARFQTADAFRNALLSVTAGAAPAASKVAPAVIAGHSTSAPTSRRGLWIAAGALCAVGALVAVVQFGPRRNAAADTPPGSSSGASVPQQTPPPNVPSPVEALPPPETKSTAAATPPVASPPQKITRPATSTTSSAPPTSNQPTQQVPQQASQQVPQQAPPATPVQTPPAQAPPVQVTPGPDLAAKRAELMTIRESFAKLSARAASVRGTLQNLQRSQAASGLGMSGNLLTPWNLMESFLKSASDAINASDIAAAKDLMDKADRQIDRLETALNK